MSNAQHTSGPWYADANGKIWRRPPSELYENGGGVAGDKPLATVNVGWSGDGLVGYPLEANARLIAAAPELLEALENCLLEHGGYTIRGDCERKARAAIAKATSSSKVFAESHPDLQRAADGLLSLSIRGEA